jgi:hypothetical protein
MNNEMELRTELHVQASRYGKELWDKSGGDWAIEVALGMENVWLDMADVSPYAKDDGRILIGIPYADAEKLMRILSLAVAVQVPGEGVSDGIA